MPPKKVIIDTDPGCDDILALLLALSSSADELQVLLVSLTFGNIDVQNALRNTVAMFYVLELERKWRIENGRKPGFESLAKYPPVVAVGAKEPLEGEKLMADYFHGIDGLGGVHTTAPHFSPRETWSHLFDRNAQLEAGETAQHRMPENFHPSNAPAHKEILRILREEEPGTVTIIALGPMTNIALAAEEDLDTFLRAKSVLVMGGTLYIEGNVTPVSEFNHYACPFSAARIYSLTSPTPQHTLPPSRTSYTLPPPPQPPAPPRPKLNLTLIPLDITTMHLLSADTFSSTTAPLAAAGSPLAQWCGYFLTAVFNKMEDLHVAAGGGKRRPQDIHLSLHDPLTIYFILTHDPPTPHTLPNPPTGKWKVQKGRDIRVEAAGQWTRGMCIFDRRTRRMAEEWEEEGVVGDVDGWLHPKLGNRIDVVVGSPGEEGFAGWMVRRIFGKVDE
ncbi:Inosine/uridine-preferring nucleoside hydrolase domain-containing protein [Kalaharituber pfeilii]|nr:Inosine/uridine-preferring nucleoside hydrolase domain-containing protein [Kalaharituber pfeilii]